MNPFVRMRELFGPNGEYWCPDGPKDDKGPNRAERTCLLYGLCRRICKSTSDQVVANKIMRDVLRAKGWDSGIGKWNDLPDTTFADIEWLLDECKSRWEVEHGEG